MHSHLVSVMKEHKISFDHWRILMQGLPLGSDQGLGSLSSSSPAEQQEDWTQVLLPSCVPFSPKYIKSENGL